MDELDGASDVDLTSNKSLLIKLKDKINQIAKKGKQETADVDDEGKTSAKESPADALKKKKSLIIKVVIGACLIGFLLMDDKKEGEGEVVEGGENPSLQIPKREKKKPADEAATAPEGTPAPAEANPAATAAAPADAAAETPAAEAPAPEVAVPEVAAPTAEAPAVEAPAAETPAVEAPAAEAPAVEAAATETPAAEAPAVEAPAAETPGAEPTDVTAAPTEAITEDPAIDLGDTGSEDSKDIVDAPSTEAGDDNLTDKILQDLEKQSGATAKKSETKGYVAPPDYEYTGRGLVYNCTGKHWACVDGPSYRICEENAAGNKYLKKPAECHPFNVYQNQKGCESMQNRMVSSSAKTTFCSE